MVRPPVESLLDVYDVAKRLNVHKETVYRWTRKGLLPAIHLPGGIRWDPNEIANYLKKLTSGKF